MGNKKEKPSRKRFTDDLADDSTPAAKRQYTSTDQQLARLYEQLADNSPNVRIQAAKELLNELSQHGQLKKEAAEKALKRLLRGLCSSRESARSGFFITLTELIRQTYAAEEPVIQLSELIALAKSSTAQSENESGQERRDYQYGRLYACKALVESSALAEDDRAWTEILELVTDQAASVTWLREECGMLLCNAIEHLEPSQASKVEASLNSLNSKGLLKTPEGVAFWLTVRSKFPEFDSFPAGVWIEGDPVYPKNAKNLDDAMRELGADDPMRNGMHRKVKQGVWKQNLHFAWSLLFEHVAKRYERLDDADRDPSVFRTLWLRLVDNGLLDDGRSLERKSWGFQLFSKVVQSVPSELLSAIFSENLVQCMMDQLGDAKKILHKSAENAMKRLKSRISDTPAVAPIVILALSKPPGTLFFDRVTRTKTLAEFLSYANQTGLEEILKHFEKHIRKPIPNEIDDRFAENTRTAIADMLLNGFRSRDRTTLQSAEASTWIGDILLVLARSAYLEPKPDAKSRYSVYPEISNETRTMFHSRLISCLAHLLSTKSSTPGHWPLFVIRNIHKLTQDSKPYKMAFQAERAVEKGIKKAYKVVKSLQEESEESDTSIKDALTVLFSLTLLQAYHGEADAISVLDDLVECYNAIIAKDNSSNAFELLVEILLGFIAKPSKVYRDMAELVFTAISANLTDSSLQSLVEILGQSESLAGQQELFEAAVDEEEDDDDSELGSDVEMLDPDVNGKDQAESADDSSEEGESVEENEEELEKFDKLLSEALQTTNIADKGDEESDGESMDDDQMMALEPVIAKVFRERRLETSKRKEKQNARENVINFKRRVLDLLAVYFKHEHANPLAVTLVLPLVRLIRTTKEKSLETKAVDLLKNYYTLYNKDIKKTPLSAETEENAWQLLNDVHKEVQENAAGVHGVACSRAGLFAARLLLVRSKDNFKRVGKVYHDTHQRWFFAKSVSIPPKFFTDWVSFSAEMRKHKL